MSCEICGREPVKETATAVTSSLDTYGALGEKIRRMDFCGHCTLTIYRTIDEMK